MPIRLMVFMLSLVFIVGCSKKQSTEPTPESNLIGNYTSISFTTSGPNDGPVDVQQAGGSIVMSLNGKFGYSAIIDFPKGMWDGYDGATLKYSGTYSVSNDTISFSSFYPGVYGVKWDKINKSLMSADSPRWAITFNLKKVN